MKFDEYEEGKYNMNYEKFFCVCHFCGSLAWTDTNEESNQLDEDGDMLVHKDIWDSGMSQWAGKYYCHSCEKPLKPLMFNKIGKKRRIEIYKMTKEKRANWMKSMEIVDELENEVDKDFPFKFK